MTRKLIAAAAFALFASAAWGQMGPGMRGGEGGGYGMGPGMMGGYGPGGYGGGRGMMGGYGTGGHDARPGAPGSYGRPGGPSSGYGPGYSPAPGSSGHDDGQGDLDRANLTGEQRTRIDGIRKESAARRAELEKRIRAQEDRLRALYASGDDAATRKAYQTLAESRKRLFEESLDARRRIDAVVNSH